jgi:adenylosuccinate synthase
LPGWGGDIRDAKTFESLPSEARDYVLFVERVCGAKVGYVSVGPRREQTIER